MTPQYELTDAQKGTILALRPLHSYAEIEAQLAIPHLTSFSFCNSCSKMQINQKSSSAWQTTKTLQHLNSIPSTQYRSEQLYTFQRIKEPDKYRCEHIDNKKLIMQRRYMQMESYETSIFDLQTCKATSHLSKSILTLDCR